jgi:hypothetical protein
MLILSTTYSYFRNSAKKIYMNPTALTFFERICYNKSNKNPKMMIGGFVLCTVSIAAVASTMTARSVRNAEGRSRVGVVPPEPMGIT